MNPVGNVEDKDGSVRCEMISMSWVLRGGWLVRVVSGVGSMIRLAR